MIERGKLHVACLVPCRLRQLKGISTHHSTKENQKEDEKKEHSHTRRNEEEED